MRILMLPGSHLAPASRFRIWQYVNPLRSLGHQVEVRVLTPERYWTTDIKNRFFRSIIGHFVGLLHLTSAIWNTRDIELFDIVIMNRDLVPEVKVDFLEPWLSRKNPRLLLDFDDAIYLGARQGKMRKILPVFAAVVAGNKYLAAFASQHNSNVHIWPTVVDTDRFQPVKNRIAGPLRIGWSGSRSTLEKCLPLVRGAICELARSHEFEFVVIADREPAELWPGVLMRFVPWSPETEVQSLQLLDIGLMPLKDELFERGKCGAKAISYMAIGIPAVVSPVGVNAEIITHGENGFHCSSDREWVENLHRLLTDAPLRRSIGRKARQLVESHYSVRALLPQMIELFEKVSKRI